MLKITHVSKKYSKVLANNDISFEVDDGEIAVLLGPNGAGKSTLIKCIVGLLRFEGEITIDGYDNKSIQAKNLLGYVPEIPAVYDMLTVREHLQFILRAYKQPDDGIIDKLLTDFELIEMADKLGKQLSKGMQQKLSICCTLAHRPKVVIFDEPMVGLDPHAIKMIKQTFVDLKGQGACVLISTHMIDSVEGYWDSAYIMSGGCLKAAKKSAFDDGKSLEQLFFEITEGGSN